MREMAAEQQKLIIAQQKLLREQQAKLLKTTAPNTQEGNKVQNGQAFYDPYYTYYNPSAAGGAQQPGAAGQSVGSRDNQGQGRKN